MVGLLDFFTGGDPAEMAQIDPRYGVPRSDVRDTAVNTLGNISALLLAAGQPIMPAQRAQLFAQLGSAGSQSGTDLYNAAQRRLMMAQMDQRRAEGDEIKRIGDLMQNPEAFKAQTGYDLQQFGGMRAADISQALRQIRIQQLGQDPNEARLRGLQVQRAERELNQPRTMEAGGVIYQQDQAGNWRSMTPARPQGGLEGEAQSIILQGMRNPALTETPDYAVAFTRLYGPRMEIRNGEVVQIMPEVPVGVPRPRGAGAASGAPQAAGGAPAGAAPAGGAAPAPQDAVPASPAANAGQETRTVTTPGGGQISITSTQPRALSAAEVKLKEETETALTGARSAAESLREALRLNGQAYHGPAALQRATAAGLTGLDRSGAEATRTFNTIMTEQALGQLRSIFGGNPTEGERKILLEMGASVNMSRTEREALVRRAITAAEDRMRSAERRLQEVTTGQYGRVQPGYTPPAASSTPALPPGFEVVR